MIVLGLSGSLRQGSYNTRLLLAAASALPPGADMRLFNGLGALPPYNEDEDADASVVELRAAIADADAVLISTPEYNASVPGQLKNALDWASRPFPDNALHHKPVAVIGASTGLFGAVWARAELRKILATIGASVIEAGLAVGQARGAFDDGGALGQDLADIIGQLLVAVGVAA